MTSCASSRLNETPEQKAVVDTTNSKDFMVAIEVMESSGHVCCTERSQRNFTEYRNTANRVSLAVKVINYSLKNDSIITRLPI
jgi:hypothetical protein